MTKEEAVEYFEGDKYINGLDYKPNAEHNERMDLAIKALRNQVDLEKVKEAISAFLGQSGECDGYLACATFHGYHFYVQGEVVRSYDELIDWYEQEWGVE